MKVFFKAAVAIAVVLVLAACGFGASASGGAKPAKATADPVTLTANVSAGQSDVPVDTRVTVTAQGGSLSAVTLVLVKDGSQITGAIQSDGSWAASSLLDPGAAYELTAKGANADGKSRDLSVKFSTQNLPRNKLTFASVTPGEGQVVGVGMPIIVQFDLPVQDKAAFERQMTVTSTPAVTGSWNWISSKVAHWRPETYWPAGTQVQVNINTKSVNAGNGVYGQNSIVRNFTVGSAMVSVVDVNAHTMTVKKDGVVLRVLPVTTGAPATASRNGIKVIMEKYETVRMDGATVGYQPGDPNYYNIANVQFAMRLTNSGEFIHAAPWSTWAQGKQNVSHACVGMSVANAQWLFGLSRVGDPVEFVGSTRPMEPNNGWTDWNVPWATWQQGSALYGQQATPSAPVSPTPAAASASS